MTQEWAQLKSWLIQAQLKATTAEWSAESWLWHWAIDNVSFVPLIEVAEQWEGTGNWDAAQWLVHWVESVDIGSSFDAANPPPTFAPGTGPCDGQPAAHSGQAWTLTMSTLTFQTGIAALALAHKCWLNASPGLWAQGTATTTLALPVAIGLCIGSPRIPGFCHT